MAREFSTSPSAIKRREQRAAMPKRKRTSKAAMAEKRAKLAAKGMSKFRIEHTLKFGKAARRDRAMRKRAKDIAGGGTGAVRGRTKTRAVPAGGAGGIRAMQGGGGPPQGGGGRGKTSAKGAGGGGSGH